MNSVRVRHTEIYIVSKKIEDTRRKRVGARIRREKLHARARARSRFHYKVLRCGFQRRVLNTYSNRRFPEMSSVVRKNVRSRESSSATAMQTHP